MRQLDPVELEHAVVRIQHGYMSYAYAERVAICLIEGRLSLREARQIASEQERTAAMQWVPGRS